MIEFIRDGSKVVIRVDTGLGSTIGPEFNCGCELYAKLLTRQLDANLRGLIEGIRKDAYETGHKEGRAKKKRRDWFPSWLRRGM